ncbi:P-loop containing nucleoside triphosphate hydrolase protein [Mycena albidolilacea]|uniref:P-loop containing nucleoside triphosphate hydrolase protein n=1 Tax=Mycena albidolilacea TaxID=1033008 RepID=A0AAD7EX40_9AGAR|nr:P-loop containing nucleoside triphosphate hydrolase protein [Mycena albidolilacea]
MASLPLYDIHSHREQELLIPAYATVISASILLLHSVLALESVSNLFARVGILEKQSDNVPPPGIGRGTILWFRLARLLGCLGLLVLSIIPFNRERLVQGIIQSTPYLYAAILALLSVSPKNTRHRLIRHANCVLFIVFSVYVYRDLIPLATFTGVPADLGEGRKLWAKIGLLFTNAVIIPLFTPQQYIPVDPLNPQTVLNPEQTASIFSYSFFFFLDPIIFLAYRESQLHEEELYPLPFAMNRLLQYIETQDRDANIVHPSGISGISSSTLRIRMKAETTATKGDVPAVEVPPSAARTGSDTESTDEHGTGADGRSSSGSPTIQASAPSVTSTASKPSKSGATKSEVKQTEGSLVGKINNLVTVDLGNIVDSRDFLYPVVFIPLQLTLGIWFLYVLLGWSVWVGVGSIVLLSPIPGYMAKLVQSAQTERLKHTDERVQSVSEAVNVLRMIKLFGWEEKMKARIEDKIWPAALSSCHNDPHLRYLCLYIFPYTSPNLLANPLEDLDYGSTAQCIKGIILPTYDNAWLILPWLSVKFQMTYWLNNAMSGKVSLDRVDNFLKKVGSEFADEGPFSCSMQTELLDAFDEKETPALFAADPCSDERIGFRNAAFSWSKESDRSLTRSRRFQLKIDDEVIFQRGRINLVVGPTGSGKTSLLMALLGEMHFIPSSPDSWYNLPRGSGVAYAAQESWVLNETIRSNIVFDTPFDEGRYKKVLYQCALEPDLGLFQAGDQTEVGEKGLTLSGGQKARLTLARAVYSKASILLLDDVLAALDVHTAQWIVEKCLGGDLIENRTVILVTHNVALTRPIADFVVSFGSDGRIQSQGTISEIAKRGPLAAQIQKDQQVLDRTQEEVDAEAPVVKPADGKLILAEEVQLGHVSASALKMYFRAMGGKYPLFFFTFFFGGLIFQQIFVALRTWQLGYWAKQYDRLPTDEVDVVFHLSVFIAIVFVSSAALAAVFVYLVFGQLRASKVIHNNLIESVLSAPLRWLDVTPTSRIIARVTNDVRAVDDSLANQFWPLTAMIVSMTIKFVAVVIYTPIFFFPGALVGLLGAWIGQIYISGQLPVKRFMSNTRAPVLAHFGAAIAGLVSIRAFGAESKFTTESLGRIDRYTRAARNYYNLNRWVSIRVDSLGAMFSAGLATYLVYIKHTSAGDSGFLLNMAITFTSMLLWAVRVFNDFEVQGTSLERIQGYINIEHEKPVTEQGKPPAYWPASGDLRVEGLSARYSEDGPKVLQDISFHIKSGERVGIVGRTGSGKSSLTLSLLRCIPTEGSVRYDGRETSELNLDALRTSITIIPQVPELLSGSLRANLDPFGQYDDVELNYALRAAGLFVLQDEIDEDRITLDSTISTGGANLSVGQRQIFALARAIVRKSKILILDEATSAIDYKTDSIIQNSLRQELRGDVSLITVAHRLQTIMDADKIMVLDAGRIIAHLIAQVEFDSPKELLKIEDGKLRALVEESGDREALYAMAGADSN